MKYDPNLIIINKIYAQQDNRYFMAETEERQYGTHAIDLFYDLVTDIFVDHKLTIWEKFWNQLPFTK